MIKEALEALKRLEQETCPATYMPDFDKLECVRVVREALTSLDERREELKMFLIFLDLVLMGKEGTLNDEGYKACMGIVNNHPDFSNRTRYIKRLVEWLDEERAE